MSNLINRDKLITVLKELENEYRMEDDFNSAFAVEYATGKVKQQPLVDTVQHAYWEPINDHTVYCSHCKTILESDKPNLHKWKKQNKFCRNCGCKMDKTHIL